MIVIKIPVKTAPPAIAKPTIPLIAKIVKHIIVIFSINVKPN
jgi:hypothetical protein